MPTLRGVNPEEADAELRAIPGERRERIAVRHMLDGNDERPRGSGEEGDSESKEDGRN